MNPGPMMCGTEDYTDSPAVPRDFIQHARYRIAKLQERIDQEKVAAKDAVSRYAPTAPGKIDNLTTPAAELLQSLPFVAAVEVAQRSRRPTCRIFQLRDYHFVPRDLFNMEVLALMGRTPSAEEGEHLYQEHLLQVELVQAQQTALLRCLAKHHGLKTVHIERLTAEGVPEFKTRIAALKEAEPHQDELRRQLADVQALLKQMADSGKEGTERYAKAKEIEREFAGLLEQHRLELLELGAVARLLVAGELQRVLPLDDAKLLDAAKPRFHNGQMVPNHAANTAHQDAMAKALLKAGPVAVAVLGGSHDLTDALNRQGAAGLEYLRVSVRAYKDLAT
jgi:hypothetical protein